MRRFVWALLIATGMLTGCGPTPTVSIDGVNFGQFEGDVVAVWDADGRNMTLREDFVYVDSTGKRWVAPANSVVNGASIPSAFWTFIGGPFEGRYRNASVVHDVGCEEMSESWEDVHRMFYEACRCGGVDESTAKTMYYAVYHFGPRWQKVTETVVETHTDEQGRVIEKEVEIEHVARMDPPPPSPMEMAQVQTFISEEKPNADKIECHCRAALHNLPCRHRPGQDQEHDHDHAHDHEPRRFNVQQAPTLAEDRRIPSLGGNRFGRPAPPAVIADTGSGDATPKFRPFPATPKSASFPGARLGGPAPLTAEEETWATGIAQQHLAEQSSEQRQAQYEVQKARHGYWVNITLLAENESGQLAPYAGGQTAIRIDRRGQVIEAISGAFTGQPNTGQWR